jgi:hypothetical protein
MFRAASEPLAMASIAKGGSGADDAPLHIQGTPHMEENESVIAFRRDLKYKIAWAVAAKLLALALLWFLFFRGSS